MTSRLGPIAGPGRAGAFPRDPSFEQSLATRTDASVRTGTTNAAIVMALALVGSVGTLASALRRRRLPPRLLQHVSSSSSVATAGGGVGSGVGSGASGVRPVGVPGAATGEEEYAADVPLEARSTAWLQRRAAELRARLGESA